MHNDKKCVHRTHAPAKCIDYVFIKGPLLRQKLVDCNPNRTWPVF